MAAIGTGGASTRAWLLPVTPHRCGRVHHVHYHTSQRGALRNAEGVKTLRKLSIYAPHDLYATAYTKRQCVCMVSCAWLRT